MPPVFDRQFSGFYQIKVNSVRRFPAGSEFPFSGHAVEFLQKIMNK